MKKADRIYRLHNLLRNRLHVSRKELEADLGVSKATLTRDIEFLRSRLRAPVVFDSDLGGYRLENTGPSGSAHELPGLWFNETEINALLAIESILESIQPGLLGPHIAPLKKRLTELLGAGNHAPDEVRRRIVLTPASPRTLRLACFEACAAATLSRRRLRITHYDRYLDVSTTREVSPQRLVRYKDNWYLDAWCHLRDALRTFSVDALTGAEAEDEPAVDVSDADLAETLSAGYGIFSGRDVAWAKIRFTPYQSRWASTEIWHPMQRGGYEGDRYVLEIPYSDSSELVMNILKYGEHATVLSPPELRALVIERLARASGQYASS